MPSERPRYITGGKVLGRAETDDKPKAEEYSERNFYIRSIDDNKNRDSSRVDSAKFPPYLNSLVNKWVSDPRTPYKSASDFHRDSAAHRVVQLQKFEEDPSFDWGHLGLAEQRERLAREAKDMHEQTEAFRGDIAAALNQGDYVWLKELIAVGAQAVEKFRDPYRSRVEEIIRPYTDGSVTIHRPDAAS